MYVAAVAAASAQSAGKPEQSQRFPGAQAVAAHNLRESGSGGHPRLRIHYMRGALAEREINDALQPCAGNGMEAFVGPAQGVRRDDHVVHAKERIRRIYGLLLEDV